MRRILCGIFWVFLFLALLTFFGGGRLIKRVGEEVMVLGDRIISYEEYLKGITKKLGGGRRE